MMEADTKKEYELSYLAKTEEAAKEIGEILKSQGAEITGDTPGVKINLAYKIKKEDSAYFGYFHFSAVPGSVKQIEDALKIKSDVLRVLLITPPFVKNKARTVAPRQRISKPIIPVEKPSAPLSNEALEKKIEEILNQ